MHSDIANHGSFHIILKLIRVCYSYMYLNHARVLMLSWMHLERTCYGHLKQGSQVLLKSLIHS